MAKSDKVIVNEREPDLLRVRGKDPAQHYRFVRKDDVRVDRAKALGYVPVTKGEVGELDRVGDTTVGPDKIVQRGDTILMRMDRETWEARKAEERRDAKSQLNRAKERHAEEMARAGGRGAGFGDVEVNRR